METLDVRPFLRLPGLLDLWSARVESGHVLPVGSPREVRLTDQEFLRFRGVRDAPTAEAFATEYGVLGISAAARRVADGSADWLGALKDHVLAPPDVEWVDDWIAMAGLLDLACGLLGILKAERRSDASLRQQLYRRARRMPKVHDLETARANQIDLGEGILHYLDQIHEELGRPPLPRAARGRKPRR